jgi:hypothetical protein
LTKFDFLWFKGRCLFLNCKTYWITCDHACQFWLCLLVPGCVLALRTRFQLTEWLACPCSPRWYVPHSSGYFPVNPHGSYSSDRTKDISVCRRKMAAKWSSLLQYHASLPPPPCNRYYTLKHFL